MTRAGAVGRCYVTLLTALAGGFLAAVAIPGARAAVQQALALGLTAGSPRGIRIVGALALHNALVALWPVALAWLGLAEPRVIRGVADALVAASLVANGALVGMALAAYGGRLVPFLVHVPLEWLGLAGGSAAWFHRSQPTSSGPLAVIGLSLGGAAALEVWATP